MRFLLLIVMILAPMAAFAEDKDDIRGSDAGCIDITGTGAWVSLTSASLENMRGSTSLAASRYWMEVQVKDGSGDVFLCYATAASCGVGTGNKLVAKSGSALTVPLRGMSPQAIAYYAGVGVTAQICGMFRGQP